MEGRRRRRSRHEGNGYWFGHAPKAAPGDEYRYRLTTADGTISKIDPYARQVTSSVGNAVVYDHAAFDWEDDDVVAPPHHELVIYELHIGSFYAPDEDRSRAPSSWSWRSSTTW